jgi:hypothetical protein
VLKPFCAWEFIVPRVWSIARRDFPPKHFRAIRRERQRRSEHKRVRPLHNRVAMHSAKSWSLSSKLSLCLAHIRHSHCEQQIRWALLRSLG